MNSQDLQKKNLPDSPGVYFFLGTPKSDEGGFSALKADVGGLGTPKLDEGDKGSKSEILYIGKATSLRDRVRSYFNKDAAISRGPIISKMITDASSVDFLKTDSVLEALILEANLIKKHQPKYNSKEKDNKSFNYVVITKEDFPRVLLIRGRALLVRTNETLKGMKIKYTFGPFPQGGSLKEALRLIRKIFTYRDNCTPIGELKNSTFARPCFNRQVGLCPGVCTGEISNEDYGEIIKNIKLFFEGKKRALVRKLDKDMKELAKNQEFEKAARARKLIFDLNHIQDVSLLKRDLESSGGVNEKGVFRVEAYDVAHTAGGDVVGVMTVVEDGAAAKSEYRKFKIKDNPGINDTAALKEVISRRLGHPEWQYPNIIVVDGGKAQLNAAKDVFEKFGLGIKVVSVVKDERHKPKNILGNDNFEYEDEILLANSEAHRFAITYHRKVRGRIK